MTSVQKACVVCYEELAGSPLCCEAGHGLCGECAGAYVREKISALKTTDLIAAKANVAMATNDARLAEQLAGCIHCPLGGHGCNSPPYDDKTLAVVLSVDDFAELVQAKILLPAARKIQQALQERNELASMLPNARQCGRCCYGPIMLTGCSNLTTHHGERAGMPGGLSGGGDTAPIDNSCPRCGWFRAEAAYWPPWVPNAAGAEDANAAAFEGAWTTDRPRAEREQRVREERERFRREHLAQVEQRLRDRGARRRAMVQEELGQQGEHLRRVRLERERLERDRERIDPESFERSIRRLDELHDRVERRRTELQARQDAEAGHAELRTQVGAEAGPAGRALPHGDGAPPPHFGAPPRAVIGRDPRAEGALPHDLGELVRDDDRLREARHRLREARERLDAMRDAERHHGGEFRPLRWRGDGGQFSFPDWHDDLGPLEAPPPPLGHEPLPPPPLPPPLLPLGHALLAPPPPPLPPLPAFYDDLPRLWPRTPLHRFRPAAQAQVVPEASPPVSAPPPAIRRHPAAPSAGPLPLRGAVRVADDATPSVQRAAEAAADAVATSLPIEGLEAELVGVSTAVRGHAAQDATQDAAQDAAQGAGQGAGPAGAGVSVTHCAKREQKQRALALFARLTGLCAASEATAMYLADADGDVESAVRAAVQGATGWGASVGVTPAAKAEELGECV